MNYDFHGKMSKLVKTGVCTRDWLIGARQADKVVVLGREGLGFESFRRRSTSPLDRLPMAVALPPKMMYTAASLVKGVKYKTYENKVLPHILVCGAAV